MSFVIQCDGFMGSIMHLSPNFNLNSVLFAHLNQYHNNSNIKYKIGFGYVVWLSVELLIKFDIVLYTK